MKIIQTRKLKKAASRCSLVIFLLAVAILTLSCTSNNEVQPTVTPFPTTAAMAKTTYTVQRGDVLNKVEIPGRIVPVEQNELFFQINGRVRNVYVQNGDEILENQVLADLEGIDDIQRVQAMNDLALERVQIHADNARLSLEMFKLLTPTHTKGYSETLRMRENEVALAEIAVKEAKLNELDVQLAISDTLLIAPIDGKITWLYLREGREVQAYQSIGTVSDVENLEVGLNIAGDILRSIESGMQVTIESARERSKNVNGEVRWVYRGFVDEFAGEDTVRITPEVSPQEAGFDFNELVNVSIILDSSEDTLWLPPFAIRKFEGRTFVVVQDGELQRRVDVRLGVVGEDRVEILEGLEEGQVVVGQ